MAQLPDIPGTPAPDVLDLGCGTADCTYSVKQRWPGACISAVDRHWPVLHAAPPFVCAIQADTGALPFKPAVFGLIIIRHPDVFRYSNDWQSAINNSAQLLRDYGCLLITCYSLPEAAQIKGWQKTGRGAPLLLRPDIISLPDLASHDRYAFAWQVAPTR